MIKIVRDIDPEILKHFNSLESDSLFVRKFVDPTTIKDVSTKTETGKYLSTGYITTLDIDRDMEVIMPKGIRWNEYENNSIVLHMHDYTQTPVGKCTKLEQDAAGWKGTTEYFVNDARNSQGFQNWEYRSKGFPMGRSIGFAPTEYAINSKYGEEFEKGWKDALEEWKDEYKKAYGKNPKGEPNVIYTQCIAYEYSDVTVPANPSCTGEEKDIDIVILSKGLNADGKISINKLKELKSIKDGNIEEDMELKEIKELLEKQQESIDSLTEKVEEVIEELEIMDAELNPEEPEGDDGIDQKLNEDEPDEEDVSIDDIQTLVSDSVENSVKSVMDNLKEQFAQIKDSMDRLTGTI